MSDLKNIYGNNVSWFCYEGSINLHENKCNKTYMLDDEFEVYGENEQGQEGSVSVCVVGLLESAHVELEAKDARIAELEGQNKTLSSLLDMFDRYQGNQDDYLDSPFCAEVRETLFSFGLIQEDERPKLTAKELLEKDGE